MALRSSGRIHLLSCVEFVVHLRILLGSSLKLCPKWYVKVLRHLPTQYVIKIVIFKGDELQVN